MTTPTPPSPEFWDALPRSARSELSSNAYTLLGAIETLRRRWGLTTFEATTQELATECGRSLWFVERTLPELRGKWIDWVVKRSRRTITIRYALKGLDEAPRIGEKVPALSPVGTGASAGRNRQKRRQEPAPAPVLSFMDIEEERDRASEHLRAEEETSRQSADPDRTGRDDFASLPKPEDRDPEPTPPPSPPRPPPDASAEIAKLEASLVADLAKLRPGSRDHAGLSRQLRSLKAHGLSYEPRLTPKLTAFPSTSSPPVSGPPVASRAGPIFDQAMLHLKLGRPDEFALGFAAFTDESDNLITLGQLGRAARALRWDHVDRFLREIVFSPKTVSIPKMVAARIKKELDLKAKTLKGATL
jgi:hypothetical protein